MPDARGSLQVFLTETWLPSIEYTVKPGTFESYRRNVRLHMAGRPIGHRQLQQVEPADLNGLYATLMRGDDEHRQLSARSVAYVATILHRAFRDALLASRGERPRRRAAGRSPSIRRPSLRSSSTGLASSRSG